MSRWKLGLMTAIFAISASTTPLFAEEDIKTTESSKLSHSFLVPDGVEVGDVRIERIGNIPVIAGQGSNGKTYYSPELFPNFQPSEISRIGKVGSSVVMITKDGKAFRLSFDEETGIYGATSIDRPDTDLASRKPKDENLLVPTALNVDRVFPMTPIKFVTHGRVDRSFNEHCPGSTTHKRGKAVASGHWAYNKGNAKDALLHFKTAANTYGSTEGKFFAGQILYSGEAGTKDYKQATQYLEAALQGRMSREREVAALYALGVMKFQGGFGLAQDEKAAAHLMKKVVDAKGHVSNEIVSAACLVLAEASLNGRGVDVSRATAMMYLDDMEKIGGPLKVTAKNTLAVISRSSSSQMVKN